MSEKPWTVCCPSCNNKKAYQGLTVVECPNNSCKFYSKKQELLVCEYENIINIPDDNSKDSSGFYKNDDYNELDYLGANNCCSNVNDDANIDCDYDDQALDHLFGYMP